MGSGGLVRSVLLLWGVQGDLEGLFFLGDIEGLAEEVRRRVHEISGIVLEWEIQRIGRPASDPEPIEWGGAHQPSRMALQGRFGEDYSDGSAPS